MKLSAELLRTPLAYIGGETDGIQLARGGIIFLPQERDLERAVSPGGVRGALPFFEKLGAEGCWQKSSRSSWIAAHHHLNIRRAIPCNDAADSLDPK